MWGMGDLGWMNFGMHGAGMLLFWGLILVAIVVLVRTVSAPAASVPPREAPDALEILKERYARGELGRDEFQVMRQDLGAK